MRNDNKDWPGYGEKCGIYAIENTVNGKFYIGQSQDIRVRWKGHRGDLRAGKHCNRHLQASWNKYGEASFRFVILEETDIESLDAREAVWLHELDAVKNGYNQSYETGGVVRGTKRSQKDIEAMTSAMRTPDARARRSASQKKRWSDPKTKADMLEVMKIGREAPGEEEKRLEALRSAHKRPETRARVSAANRATWADPEIHAKRAAANREKRQRPESRAKTSEQSKISMRAKSRLTENDVESIRSRYVPRCKTNGGTALAQEFGVSPSVISSIIRRKAWV